MIKVMCETFDKKYYRWKIPASSSGEIDTYNCLIFQEILTSEQRMIREQVQFKYFPIRKVCGK